MVSEKNVAVAGSGRHDGPVNTHADSSPETDVVWCFQCGSEYDLDVETCKECGVPTTDVAPTTADDVGDAGDDQMAYELHEWTGQGRSLLDGMLSRLNVEHAWQGATLIVREADEEAVDASIAEIEVVAMPTLDPAEPTIVYELDELDDQQHGRLLRRLGDGGLNHAFDGNGDLFVYERDEAKVDEIFSGLEQADLSEREFGEGISEDPLSVITDMFVALTRLRKRPNEGKSVVNVVETAQLIEQMRLPYGMGVDVWSSVVDQSADLSDLLTSDEVVGNDEVEEKAAALHGLLRRLV